jgi:hypothetical protein
VETEVKRLQDEVVILKTAIEEAIREGQKSVDDIKGITRSGPVSNKKSAPTRTNAGSRTAGWGDDF